MNEKTPDIKDYLRIINKRRRVAIAFFIIFSSTVLLWTFSSMPVYMASTKLIIEKSEQNILQPMHLFMPYDPEFYETQYQTIKSTAVAKRVVKMLALEEEYDSFMKENGRFTVGAVIRRIKGLFGPGVGRKAGIAGAPRKHDTDMLAQAIIGGISVNPVRDSRIVTISYSSTNPELAAMVTNSIAKAYIEQILDMRLTASRNTLEWMRKKSEEERTKLLESEKALNDYIRENNIITLENRIAIIPQKLTELGSQLTGAESRMQELGAVYERIMSTSTEQVEVLPPFSSDQSLESLRKRIMEAEQNMIGLSKRYGEKHPMIISAAEELNALKSNMKREIKRVVESLKNEYELAKTMVEQYGRRLSETKSEALVLNEKFIQYEVLKKDVETNRQLFDALMKRIKEQSITEQLNTVNVWILKEARVPVQPIKPNKPRNILLGLIIGLFGGIFLAIAFEHFDDKVYSPEDAEEKLGIPVLGVIPLIKGADESVIEDVVSKEPMSHVTEMYKTIRTAIFMSSAEAYPKRLLVTSMGPKEGKTVTSINLATVISQYDRKVLLIDSDLRRPSIHKLLGLDNKEGLSTYLTGFSDLKINTTDDGLPENLDVITSGPIPPNPSELLGSKIMVKLLEEVERKYDIIIFDSPPIMNISDSMIMSGICYGTVFVIRAGQTTYDSAIKGIRSITDIKSHVLGTVINGNASWWIG
jgi:capsular exopolysaccharide synthesis family protein